MQTQQLKVCASCLLKDSRRLFKEEVEEVQECSAGFSFFSQLVG